MFSGRVRDGLLSGVVLAALAALTLFLCVVAWQHAHPDTAQVVRDDRVSDGGSDTPTRTATDPISTPTDTSTGAADAQVVRTLWLGGPLTQADGATATSQGYRAQVVAGLRQDGKVTQRVTDVGLDAKPQLLAATSTDEPFDVVVLELTATQQTAQALDDVIGAIGVDSPDATIVCLGGWGDASAVRDSDDVVSQACGAVGATFIPLVQLHQQRDLRTVTADGADRPDDDGYSAIADRVSSAVGQG